MDNENDIQRAARLRRTNSSHDSMDWTVRDMLVRTIERIDAGELKDDLRGVLILADDAGPGNSLFPDVRINWAAAKLSYTDMETLCHYLLYNRSFRPVIADAKKPHE